MLNISFALVHGLVEERREQGVEVARVWHRLRRGSAVVIASWGRMTTLATTATTWAGCWDCRTELRTACCNL